MAIPIKKRIHSYFNENPGRHNAGLTQEKKLSNANGKTWNKKREHQKVIQLSCPVDTSNNTMVTLERFYTVIS